MMQVAILGAGAMGSWFGGQLALQGHDVELLTTNKEHINAVRENGLLMQTGGSAGSTVKSETVQVVIHPPNEYSGNADLVIVLTKSFQTDDAISAIANKLTGHTAVLSLQNGVGNADAISKFVTPKNIWVGMTMMPVDRIAPGIIESRGQGKTRFGHLDGQHHPFGDQIAQAFSGSGMDVQHDREVHATIWEKVAFNTAMNALSALTHGTPGTIGQLPDAKALAHSIATEAELVARAEGIKINLDSVFATIDYACKHHGDHKPSMLQDLLAGRRTEVDALNGAIATLGARHELPTPLNDTLTTLIRLSELGDHSS